MKNEVLKPAVPAIFIVTEAGFFFWNSTRLAVVCLGAESKGRRSGYDSLIDSMEITR